MTALQKSTDWKWTVDEIVDGTKGKLLQRGDRTASWVGTDTRGKLEGSIFFALKGDRFDAHDFVATALQTAAVVVIHAEPPSPLPRGVSVIRVSDTLLALQNFAHWHRKRWDGRMIALTGTNGKTTTKEFCRTLLSLKFPTLATEGSLNNHWGVPLTLLKLRPHHRFAVVEMGMNHHGEITRLCQIAEPDIGLVTNVGRGHMEFFDSVEDVAKAKAELYQALRNRGASGISVFNLDNPHTKRMAEEFAGKSQRSFSFSTHIKDTDVSLKEKLFTLDYIDVQGSVGGEPGEARIPVFGRQQVANASAAACVGLAAGLDPSLIWKGLAKCEATWGRGQIIQLECGARVLFDAYNANPESVTMAIENFQRLATRGQKFVVLGEMLELGSDSESFHREVGKRVGELNPSGIWFVGSQTKALSAGLAKTGYSNKLVISDGYDEKLALSFLGMLKSSDIVLVKGSRGMRLERVIEAWHPRDYDEKH